MRGRSLFLAGILVVGTLQAEPSSWEVRGDAFLQAGNYQRALLAYETALASDPDDKVVLDKYQKTFLLVLSEQKVQADAGRNTGSLNRMGARPQPSPEPSPVPGEEEAGEGGEGEEATRGKSSDKNKGDSKAKGKAKGKGSTKGSKGASTTDGGEDAEASADGEQPAEGEDPADTIRVREDGTIELRFGSLNRMGAPRGGSRMGGTSTQPDEEEAEEDEGPPEPAVYGGGQTVGVSKPKLGFEGSQGDEVAPENTVIRTTKYKIENVTLSYRARALEVSGSLENISGNLIKLPRVYVSIFDEAGVLRGRNFGYIYPGRNLLARGATKKWKVAFRGFSDPVESYRIEVIP